MKKNKRTRMLRRALISSVASLILCCAMLIGTTYAWLTETVTSGQNRVIAGKMDVRLLTYTEDLSGERTYEDITGATEKLFTEAWEPGEVKSLNLAIENSGTLDMKYEIGLIVKDGGLADMLEYSVVPVDEENVALFSMEDNEDDESEGADTTDEDEETEDDLDWFSVASDSNAEEANRIYYTTIVEPREMAAEREEDIEEAATMRARSSDSEEENQREHFILSIRMKDFVDKEQLLQYADAMCEIDIRIIATQVVEEGGDNTIPYNTGADQSLTEFNDYIYHISTVQVVVKDVEDDFDEDSSDDDEAAAVNDEEFIDEDDFGTSDYDYVTGEEIQVESNNGMISLVLPEELLLENPDEKDQVTVLIAASPVETPEHIVIEEIQTSRSVEVQIRGLSEDNEVPYTMTQYVTIEDALTAIVYPCGSEEEWFELSEDEELYLEYDPELGFGYSYDRDSGEIIVWCAQSGTFTFVFEQEELVEE